MKKLFFILGALTLAGCGEGLQIDDPVISQVVEHHTKIHPNSSNYLDAAFVDGAYGAPPFTDCTQTWTDLSGASYDGTLVTLSCNQSDSGWVGSGTTASPYALALDGTDYVTTTLDAQNSAMAQTTWEAWIYPTRLNHGTRQTIFSVDDGGFDRSLLIEQSTSDISAFTGAGIYQAAALSANNWYHVVVVYSATDIKVYVNGTAYSFGSAFTGAGATTRRFTIGTNPSFTNEAFKGKIAMVGVYTRALSQSEITESCQTYANRFSGAVCN